MCIMELKGITKIFPGVIALNNVSLKVNKGEILALVGENGAGKSTLMHVLSGKYVHGTYDGEIIVNGESKIFKNTNDSVRAGIAMIYQELNAHLEMNVVENIFMGDWIKKKGGAIDWKKMFEVSKELLARVNLDINPKLTMRELTNAQQQMVAICHVLRKNPNILIMDEPTSTLPKKEVEVLFEIIKKLKSEGITIILITHKMNEVFELCDRIEILRNGETVGGDMTVNLSLDQVVERMIGRKLEMMYPQKESTVGKELLRVENLTVRHPFNKEKNIVENVSFVLNSGEILGLEGLVGSGRTEILNAIYGQGDIVSGKVFVSGKEVKISNSKEALSHGIALITEDRRVDGFVGMHSIKQNISMSSLKKVSTHGRINHKIENNVVSEYMNQINIKAPNMETKVENLSGGNQQKVVISKCLLTDPMILFMDEPTRGIDVGAKSEIYNIMNEQAMQGKGVIMTSSERTELLNITDRLVVLSNGKVQGELCKEQYDEKVIVDMAVRS